LNNSKNSGGPELLRDKTLGKPLQTSRNDSRQPPDPDNSKKRRAPALRPSGRRLRQNSPIAHFVDIAAVRILTSFK
jgi:hypothetical protein